MKNLKQIIFAALLVIIMITTVTVNVFAGDNLSVEDVEKIVSDIEKLNTAKEKEYAIRYAMLDFSNPSFDPTASEFAELMARFYKQSTVCAMLYLKEYDEFTATDDVVKDTNEKYAILNSASRLLNNGYADKADDYETALAELNARHILILDEYIGISDMYDTYEEKKAAIKVVLKYLDSNSERFTEDNYNEEQFAEINVLLDSFAGECLECVTCGLEKLTSIENDMVVSSKTHPLDKINAKRVVLDEVAELMSNDYVKRFDVSNSEDAVVEANYQNYQAGLSDLARISMALINDLADIIKLTERPSSIKDDKAFAYLKNEVLIDIDQIVALGYCENEAVSEEYATYLAKRDTMNVSVISVFIDMLPTEYIKEYVNGDTNGAIAQLHAANSTAKQIRNLFTRYFKDAENEAYKAQKEIFDSRCKLYNKAYDEYIIFRDNKAPLSDYDNPEALMSYDGTKGTKPTPIGANSASGIKEYTNWSGTTDSGVYFKPEGQNFYFTFSSDSLYNTTGVIIEFDVTTFDDEYDVNLWFNHGSTTRTSSGASLFPPNIMGICSDGSLHESYSISSKLILENVIVPGEWTRIAFAYDATKCEYNIYVDGIIAQEGRDARIDQVITWYLTAFRMNVIDTKGDSTVVLDNFAFYEGTTLRTYDRYAVMSDDDRFKIYADIYSDETQSAPVRLQAYDLGAKALIDKYYNAAATTEEGKFLTDNAEIIDIIKNKYLVFKYDEVLTQYQDEKMMEFKKKVDALKVQERGFNTITTRNTLISTVDSYISLNADYLVKGKTYQIKDENGEVIESFDYLALSTIIESVRTGIQADNLYKDFCEQMRRYERGNTTIAKQKYYDAATLIKDNELFDKSLIGDSAYETGNPTLSAAWEKYNNALAKIQEMTRKDNSQIIIKCVEVIKEYDTVAEWEANFDYVNEYVTIMREIINGGPANYDETVEGFAIAKLFYDSANEYFYAILQQKHVDVLNKELDKFASLTTYIEKIGFRLFIDEYIAKNDIDYSNPKVLEVINRYNIYLEDISAAKSDYQSVLDQNTMYFVNLVIDMQTCVTYEEIRAKIEEGAPYLYAMNLGDPDAEQARLVYEEYDARLKRYEASCKQLSIQTALLAACYTEDDMFETLVNCSLFVSDVRAILDGVAESDNSSEIYTNARSALALYDAAYAVYNASISGDNANILAIIRTVGTLRDPAQIDTIVASMLTKMDK